MAIGRIVITDKQMKNLQETGYLQENGWQTRTYAMNSRQTYLQGILFALPFLFLAGGMYRTFLLERAVLLDHTGIVLLAAAAVSLPVHEALHGLGWKLGGRLGREQVSLIFRHGMPMCTCRVVLPVRAYLTGTLLPFIVLGGGSFIYLVACPGTVSLLTTLVNLTLPGADLAIAYKVLRSGADMVADSPKEAGFVALFRGAEQ